MAPKRKRSIKQTNPPLMRSIYWAIVIGIIAVFVIVTLEGIVGIMRSSTT
ncbi:hypothetical protein [Rheinheimera baltica]|uniref:Uncharacterized protein n=1 Tax=Rheinheimera baltica TaxID=67576 RepID=A0ABT9HW62_9GAMM|nr:hypothetical protein [Rheinheimera baltica]MDP5135367.1 hypothetical protein [Rheinheimera baltica]MDP5144561.1 hypothetical protein [Rheinheimera baltica]MDP5149168.1 hypothetical protein [Rheinheimera baltica]MDP5191504.1 hypothetical protein [Rheinheimera baltica]